MEKKLSFEQWLLTHVGASGPIGKLADDFNYTGCGCCTRRSVLQSLKNHHASPEALSAFHEAVQMWLDDER